MDIPLNSANESEPSLEPVVDKTDVPISQVRARGALFYLSLVAIAFICFAIFMYINSSLVGDVRMAPYDQTIIHLVRHGATPALTAVAFKITYFGSFQGVTIFSTLAILIVAFQRKWFTTAFIFSCSALSAAIMNFAKDEVHRPRPDVMLALVLEPGFSFPSGHSMVSTSFYGALLITLLPHLPKIWQRVCAVIVYLAFLLSIGWSRIYLGVHYPSDVFAGFCLGIAWLSTCFVLYTSTLHRLKRHEFG